MINLTKKVLVSLSIVTALAISSNELSYILSLAPKISNALLTISKVIKFGEHGANSRVKT